MNDIDIEKALRQQLQEVLVPVLEKLVESVPVRDSFYDRQEKLVSGLDRMTETQTCLRESLIKLAENQRELIVNQKETTKTQQDLTTNLQSLSEHLKAFATSMEQISQIQMQMADNQSSLRAAIERIERVLDYLLRRDGERDKQD